jgi:hypothetical protein
LRAFTCSTTELRTCVRKESNLRPCGHEVTALFTTGRGDTIREQAIAETPARRSPCGPGSALSAELPAHGTPGGIRTRDLSFFRRSNSDLHHGSCKGWRGIGDAVAALAGHEVTDIFTTALPRRIAGLRQSKRHAGEQAISVSMTPTQALPRGRTGARGRNGPREAASTVRDVKGGIRTRFSHGAKYPKSSPPALVEPQDAANQN